jgi:hypothetical protein
VPPWIAKAMPCSSRTPRLLKGLELLREELDQLKRFKDEDEDDAAEIRDLYRDDEDMDAEAADWGMDEDEDEDEDMLEAEGYFEDAAAVALAENEDEVAAETMLLPIHSVPSKASDANLIRTPAKAAPSIQGSTASVEALPSFHLKVADPLHQLRHKMSARFNKGGAFHAQEFAKSLGKGSARRAGGIQGMNRALEEGTKK